MTEILGHIFYALGIFVLIKMIYSLVDNRKLIDIQDWKFRFYSTMDRKPKDSEFRSKDELDTLGAHMVIGFVEAAWCAIGLAFSGRQEYFAVAAMAILASSIGCRLLAYGRAARLIRTAANILRTVLYLLLIAKHFYQ